MGEVIKGKFKPKRMAKMETNGLIPITMLWMVTVPIFTPLPLASLGTGFFLFQPTHEDDPHLGQVFLITNKHVIHEEKSEREKVCEIVLGIHRATNGGIVLPENGLLEIRSSEGCRYKGHPSDDVDVLAIYVTDIFNDKAIIHSTLHSSLLATPERIKEFGIVAGDDVLVIGYPRGYRQGPSNLPIIRRGSLATQPGMTFNKETGEDDKPTKEYRGFLIDSISLPGASGSPVLLKEPNPKAQKKYLSRKLSAYPPVLGILSETFYFNIPGSESRSVTGFGFACDAQTILETIEQFEKDCNSNSVIFT